MKSRTMVLIGVLVLIVAIGLYGHYGNNPQTPNASIKIGALLPLTGDAAEFGEKMKQGIELAQAEFPDSNVTFVIEDSKGLGAKEAVTAYRKLRDIDKVDIIIGPFGPEATLAIAPLTDKEQVPVIAISLCESRFLEHPSVYCEFPALDAGIISAKPYLQKLNVRTVGVLTLNGELGNLIEDTFKDLEQEGSFDLVGTERVNPGEHDMRTVLRKLMSQKPDAIYIASTPEEGHLALRQLHELGYTGYRFAQIDTTQETLDGIGEAMRGVYFPGFISSKYPPAFEEAYKSKFGSKPDLYVALGHTPAHFLLSYLKGKKEVPSDVVSTLWQHSDQGTSITKFSFNKDRQVDIPQVVFFYDGKSFYELDK